MIHYFLGLLLLPIFTLGAFEHSSKLRMVDDLEIIKNEFEINYAPAEWKNTCFGWDLADTIAITREKILAAESLTAKSYMQLLREFFFSTRDMHVGVDFYTTEYSVLPFIVQGASGRVFVAWYDKNWAKLSGIPLEIGDEILSFDHMPINALIEDIQKNAFGDYESETARRLSEIQLTVRDANTIYDIPSGTIEILFSKKGTGKLVKFSTKWRYVPEEILNNFSIYFPGKNPLGKHPFFYKSRILPAYNKALEYGNVYAGKVLGAIKSPFPDLGEVIWKSYSQVFHAYIFRSNDQDVGYIRIPDFDGDVDKIEEFRSLVAIMEKRTQSLIVDLTNNPGGYSFYALAIASMLTDKPLINLNENCSITQEDVYFAINDVEKLSKIHSDDEARNILGDEICGFTVDKRLAQSILDHGHFIKEQYIKGNFLTEAYPVEGLPYIYPHVSTHYSKPLYLLVNGLSISCADLLPALLQDNQRAKIIGSRTAGAGGYVINRKYSNRFGVQSLFLTGSLIRRLDGTPLENKGVEPDVIYEYSVEDYQNDYADFIQFMHEQIL